MVCRAEIGATVEARPREVETRTHSNRNKKKDRLGQAIDAPDLDLPCVVPDYEPPQAVPGERTTRSRLLVYYRCADAPMSCLDVVGHAARVFNPY
jgi:hypothetical protein